ncbi:hypothetical protein QL285_075449 [Trifolium repens]|nr:hypothetical protein QL285_075449 [Trifolium repens]
MSSSTKTPTKSRSTTTAHIKPTVTNEVPLNVDPITTVLPDETIEITPPKTKSKKKKSKKNSKSVQESQTTAEPEKKERKLKRGECRFPLNMDDLLTKDDPFNLKAKSNVESSENTIKDGDVEASSKASTGADTTKSDKGKFSETLGSAENLGLDALNDAIDDMDVDMTGVRVEEKGDDTVHQTPEIPEKTQDVGPDAETSLDQQANISEGNTEVDAGKDETLVSTEKEAGKPSSGSDLAKGAQAMPETTVELHSEDEETSVHQEYEVINVADTADDGVDEVPISQAFGISKRLRSSKGKCVAGLQETPQPVKKTTGTSVGIGPKKGWSKVTPKTSAVKTRKRKAAASSDTEYNVEEDVPNIPAPDTGMKKSAVKSTVKRAPTAVKSVPTDKISFHYPEYSYRWKYIYHRRLALERELGEEAQKVVEVVDLIREAGLMKTISKLGPCYEQIVKEFLVNIPEDCDDPASDDFQTVFVRGEAIKFSPKIINNYLGIVEEECQPLQVTDAQVCKVITANQIKVWPKKGKIPSAKLSVKYAMLNRIAATNWVPTTHSSDVATELGRLIFAVGTHKRINMGKFIFDQTIKHAKSTAVKLPIAFPTLLCDLILEQQPALKTVDDVAKPREAPLSFHFKLFAKHHAPDIVGTSGTQAPEVTMSRKDIVVALKDTCVMLDEKKALFEKMIAALEREEEVAEAADNQNEEENAEDNPESEAAESGDEEETDSDPDN